MKKLKFEGSLKDKKWYNMFNAYKLHSLQNEFEPDNATNPKLYQWMWYQKNQVRLGKLDSTKAKLFNAIVLKSSLEKKRLSYYEKLVEYRKENPSKWPQYDRKNSSSEENKLCVFCLGIRKQYQRKNLNDYWIKKMEALNFRFEIKSYNWPRHFEDVKALITNKNSVSVYKIGDNAYAWISRHRRLYHQGKLSDYKAKKIEELNLDRFFAPWEDRFYKEFLREEKFNKVALWVKEHGKIPTRLEHKDFNTWLISQRVRYKKGFLTSQQIEKLKSIDFDLEGLGKEINEQKWLNHFNKLKVFLETNHRYPGPAKEKDLYIWVQSQRALKAGNLKNRLPLSKKRVDHLNSIGFKWIGESIEKKKSWEKMFEEFTACIKPIGRLELPYIINGKKNPLYSWWCSQKKAFKRGTLSEDRIKSLMAIGVDFRSDNRKRRTR